MDKKHYLIFLSFWNDHETYPKAEDVAKAIGITTEAVKSKAKRYRQIQRMYPEQGLPPILDRSKLKDGEIMFQGEEVDFSIETERLKGKKKFFITSAQYGAEINNDVFESIKTYCKANDAELVIMPVKYGSLHEGVKDPLKPYLLTRKHFFNKSVQTNSLNLRPTLVNPLTSLERTGKSVTQIFAHPKHASVSVARGHSEHPKVVMTTGSVTFPNYKPDKTGLIAVRDHCFGGVILDIIDEKRFTFRHVKADEFGRLFDITGVYTPDAVEKATPEALVMGDWHCGETCDNVRDVTFGVGGIVDCLRPKNIFVHDLFDGRSISHHDEKNLILMAKKSKKGLLNLERELQMCSDNLFFMKKNSFGARIYVVASNHDEHLDRYLSEGRYIKDFRNFEFAHKLVSSCFEKGLPAMIDHLSQDHPDVNFLQRDEVTKMAGVRLDMHGDLGQNGSRGSVNQFDKVCDVSVTAHTHSPCIKGTSYQIGTSTRLKLLYTRGLTSWMNTHGIVWGNGTVQLINIIDGRWN